ncbi:MAG: hypothetical protein U9R68_10425, partial [Planctomycetota bacterium]|nr:hypothetical protein [Planctomycetota bacterium]
MTSDTSLAWEIEVPTGDIPVPTGLEITRAHGVVADVLDADGGVLYQGLGTIDMRWLDAGTYYLRVYNPHVGSQTEPVRFAIDFMAPFQGQAHDATDMDRIEGDDGDDILVGGAHLDRLFGESGEDAFLTEAVEVRDLAPYEFTRSPDAEDRLVSDKPAIIDPAVNEVFTDPALIQIVAVALDVPLIWDSFTYEPRFAIPVHASEMNTLTRLDLSYAPLTNLNGLQYATNLMTLDLSDTSVFGLMDAIEPRAAEADMPDAGLQVGLRRLKYLSLDRSQATIAELEPLELIVTLEAISASGNSITNTGALEDMYQMRWLDLSDNVLTSVDSLARMPDLEYVLLENNYILDVGPLVYAAIIDDGDWDIGYGEYIGDGSDYRWLHNVYPVDTAFRGDYHFLPADTKWNDEDVVARYEFTGLPFDDYEVLATWHAHQGQASSVTYAIPGPDEAVDVVVNQKFDPAGPTYGGRPWQSLGVFQPLPGETLPVTLQHEGTDGTVVADALLLLSTEGPVTNLRLLNLLGNGLNTGSH